MASQKKNLRRKSSGNTVLVEKRSPGYIVVFRRPSEKNLSTIADILKVKEAKGVSARASCAVFEARSGDASRPRLYHRLGVAVTDLTRDEIGKMEAHDDIAAVAPNEVRTIPPIPELNPALSAPPVAPPASMPMISATSDPLLAYLQGLRDASDAALRFANAGEESLPAIAAARRSRHSWCLDLIGLDASYSVATGEGVRVAVLDTGIDTDHPDFKDVFTEGDNAVSFVPGESVLDGNGHGTHCAGVVGGPGTSAGRRRYGVAPDVELFVGKVLGDNGRGRDDWILDGIDWAADAGARVISMSLGAPRRVGGRFTNTYETVAENLLESSPGTLFVAAAGNESNRPWSTAPVGNPAACPSVMAVAALDYRKQVGFFSCRQMDDLGEVDLSAPGVSVYSAWTGGGYRSISGTSMATPHVAGIAALYLERAPDLSARELWDRLLASVVPLGDRRDFGQGLAQVP